MTTERDLAPNRTDRTDRAGTRTSAEGRPPGRPEPRGHTAEDILRALTTPAVDAIFCKDRERRYTFCNPAVERMLGLPAEQILGRTPEELFGEVDTGTIRAADEANLRGEAVDAVRTLMTHAGERMLHVIQMPIRDEHGAITGLSGIVRDVTREHATEKALRESEQRYALAIRAGKIAVWEMTVGEQRMRSDGSLQDLLGYDRRSLNGDSVDWQAHLEPEGYARVAELLEEIVTGRAQEIALELPILRVDGSRSWVFASGRVVLDEAGQPERPLRLLGTTIDIMERVQLEEQLRLSQKLEAIGRLAGGVAHDFNNLLTSILGNASLALLRSGGAEPLRKNLEDIVYASERAAELTQQLLAFSRRQVLAPRSVNLNDLVGRFRRMLERLLGEDLTLVARLGEPLWPVRVDPGQIEQVLANLAVNARDAMPGGGTLTIETSNLSVPPGASGMRPAGDWVLLRMRDTGQGMNEEVRAHIFEPFYTTKPQGKGTGLGLSTVYGIVQQHDGLVEVSSALGRGTEFRVLLPRAADAVETATPQAPEPGGAGRGETILVVEDETLVRELCVTALREAGYEATAVPSGEAALEWVHESAASPALLITDVVMPGIHGQELVTKLRETQPDLRILFMSGYTGDTVLANGVPQDAAHFIGKPFRPSALARLVREILDEPGERG